MFKAIYIRLLVVLIFGMLTYSSVSQGSNLSAPRKVVQIAGVVLDNDNLTPIPYAHISVSGSARGTSADINGFFSLATYVGDVLIFSSVGFQSVSAKIFDTIGADRYTIYQSMQRDTLELPLAVIYPWPSKEKFRDAFLNLNIPDDDIEIARKNMLLSELRERAKHTKMNAGMNYKHLIQQRTDRLYYTGQVVPNNLLNPFAWGQFLRIWNQQKDEKKRQKARDWDAYEP